MAHTNTKYLFLLLTLVTIFTASFAEESVNGDQKIKAKDTPSDRKNSLDPSESENSENELFADNFDRRKRSANDREETRSSGDQRWERAAIARQTNDNQLHKPRGRSRGE
mgnify:CR=1 FL=1